MIGHDKRVAPNPYHQFLWIGGIMLAIFTYVYLTASQEVTMKVGNYIQVLTLIIFTITGIVTVRSFKIQTDDRAKMVGIHYANLTQGKVADIDKMFMANPLLDRLYYQMYSHDPHIKVIVKMRGPVTESVQMLKMEHQAANLIFQKMADIYACEKIDRPDTDCIEWINTFRAWMKSPILRSHWKYLQYEQHPEFRNFVSRSLIQRNNFIKVDQEPKPQPQSSIQSLIKSALQQQPYQSPRLQQRLQPNFLA